MTPCSCPPLPSPPLHPSPPYPPSSRAAGASLVELYTAFAYEGPALVPRIKRQLAECLKRDGFKCVSDAVGADHRPASPAAAGGAAKRRGWFS